MSDQKKSCCSISGYYLEPKTFYKILDHPLRKRILHKLYALTMDKPVTKKALAKALGVGYLQLLYQLNHYLRHFWEVKEERKIRGTREELIAPSDSNTIYIMLGTRATIYMLDPLANLFGKISEIGTRCDLCSREQISKCLEKTKIGECFSLSPEEKNRQERLLGANSRSAPYTMMDHIVSCTILRSLEGEGCEVLVTENTCEFLEKVTQLNTSKKS